MVRYLIPIFLLFSIVFVSTNITFQPKSFGNIDFTEVWSAVKVFKASGDFYDPVAIESAQQHLGLPPSYLAKWYPPWFTTFLSPLLDVPLTEATRYYFLLNSFAIIISITLLLTEIAAPITTIWASAFLVALLMPPTIATLNYGQPGGLLLLGVTLLFIGMKRSNAWLSSCGIILMSIKPHLFLLVGAFTALWAIKENKIRFLALSLIPILVIASLHALLMPDIFNHWLTAPLIKRGEQITAMEWIPATFPGIIKSILTSSGTSPIWPTLLIPLLAGIILLICYRKKSHFDDFDFQFPLVTCLSIFLAPYGWIFDQTITIPALIMILIASLRSKNLWLALLLCSMLTIEIYYYFYFAKTHEQLFWFPLPIIILLGIVLSKQKLKELSAP